MISTGDRRFADGDRVFSHYTMKWGNVVELNNISVNSNDIWYDVRWDDGSTDLMNQGTTAEFGRIMSPELAQRFWPDYPDPKENA